MKNRAIVIVCVVLFAFLASETANAQQELKKPTMQSSRKEMPRSDMDPSMRPELEAMLSGANEVPKADADGSGEAEFTLSADSMKVCYELAVENIAEATAAHIHHAPAGENGPVVVALNAPADGSSKGCVEEVSADVIKDLLQNPADYYVNVHNADYPAGAVRGQLSTVALGK
ncbi:MAG: CHRD domain-containing protein [Rhodothermales bacterium]